MDTTEAVDAWYDRINNPGYDFDKPGYYNNPGTGHFTQIVWKDSCKIGCGVAGEGL